jgi:hypothetical protein
MQTNWRRAVVWAVTMPTAIAVLAGCGGSHGTITMNTGAVPAGTATPSAAAEPTKSGSPTPGTDTTPATSGCPAGGAAVPKDAGTAETADLDGDGKADTLWLAIKGNDRVLGVTTASGARFSTVFTNQSSANANAVGGRLGDGTSVILLDFVREAKLYVVTGCKIVPSLNIDGEQYSFDEGVTGFGSGVGCPEIKGQGRRLVGYLAEPGGNGDGYIVTRTLIKFSRNGTLATNGAVQTVDEGAPESDPDVIRAKEIICGPGERANEPAG